MIIDNDVDFRRRFSGYIASGCGGIAITVGGEEAAEDTVMQGADHIICDENISAEALTAVTGSGVRCTLLRGGTPDAGRTIEKSAGNAAEQEHHEVFKFQSAADIIRAIPELYEQAAVSGFMSDARGGMSVICVTGMTGGCGRTSFSMTLARLLRQKKGENVLVIGTAQMTDLYNYFSDKASSSGGADMDLLLLNYASGVRVDPSAYLISDEYGVSCVRSSPDGASDFLSMTAEELAGFISYIRGWNIFGAVIFDMDGRFDERSRCLYESADAIYAIHDDRRCPFGAEDIWRDRLAREAGTEGDTSKNINYILNYDMSGGAVNRIFYDEESLRSEKLYDSCLPADPDSFFIKDGRADVSMSGPYAAAVDGICRRMARS